MSKWMGDFQCSKYTLMGLNFFYIIVGIILISVSTQWSNENKVTDLPIVSGIVACGVFLILISILGIFGAARHHQIILFFYMVILFLVFIIQFSVACACLSVSNTTQSGIAEQGWNSLTNYSRQKIQEDMTCCNFNEDPDTTTCPLKCQNCSSHPCCPSCGEKIVDMITKGFQIVGGVSLFFSFTECLGIWLTIRFRNMGPRALLDPSHSSEFL